MTPSPITPEPTDLVVTVPKTFTHPCAPGKRGLAAWIAEGDAAGDDYSGREWSFTTYGNLSLCVNVGRLYIVCENKLRGYAPIVRVMYDESRFRNGSAPIAIVRGGDAVAVTIDENIVGFRGIRKRWWNRKQEREFPAWRTP